MFILRLLFHFQAVNIASRINSNSLFKENNSMFTFSHCRFLFIVFRFATAARNAKYFGNTNRTKNKKVLKHQLHYLCMDVRVCAACAMNIALLAFLLFHFNLLLLLPIGVLPSPVCFSKNGKKTKNRVGRLVLASIWVLVFERKFVSRRMFTLYTHSHGVLHTQHDNTHT